MSGTVATINRGESGGALGVPGSTNVLLKDQRRLYWASPLEAISFAIPFSEFSCLRP